MSMLDAQLCYVPLLETSCSTDIIQQCQEWEENQQKKYNCSLPGLEGLIPGQDEGVTANYLSFNTDQATPHFRTRASEIEACTGGTIIFTDAKDIFKDPIQDLGTKTSVGSEVYDAYLMIYSFTSEASSLGLLETLNDRIRDKSQLQYLDIFAKVRAMGEYRKDGKTNIDLLMADGDFLVPIIRIDLLEKFNMSLPNTWEELVEYAKFFNGTDLNDDGVADDYGFCHYPRIGSGFNDEWVAELLYSTWATSDQTTGIQQGFFFDEDTMEPRIGEGFGRAAEIWKELFANGGDGCITSNFVDGRCAIGFAPPGCWKPVFVGSDGVSRKDDNGTVIWRPTMKNGDYAEPYRFKTFGSMSVIDRETDEFVDCTPERCPKGEKIPDRLEANDRARVLPISPDAGKRINRVPFYWSGGYGTGIRKSADDRAKDLMWEFFVYVNSPVTSVQDVVQPSWLDSWRYSQLEAPGDNFINAGWSEDSYREHAGVMNWALGPDVNSAFNLRLPGLLKYTHEVVGDQLDRFVNEEISVDELIENVHEGWIEVTLQEGKLDQLKIYRASLGLEELSEFDLCTLHRDSMDARDPSICIKYDPATTSDQQDLLLVYILVPVLVVMLIIGSIWIYLERKRRAADAVWQIKKDEMKFDDPPEIAGRGTFGLVVIAEYRGTHVAVKRVIPPKERVAASMPRLPRTNSTQSIVSRRLSNDSTASHPATDEPIPKEDPSDHAQQSDYPSSSVAMPKRKNSMQHSVMSSLDSNASTHHGSSGGLNSSNNSGGFFGLNWFGARSSKHYEQLKSDFVVEMRTLSKLRHPCITTVMGCVMQKGEEPMLVMEYMDNGSLYDLLHNETIVMDGDLIFPMLQDIARGARFLHAATPKVIHGDLKAANVLVDGRFRAKISDFGLSAKKKYIGAQGTPYWMAPELLLGTSRNSSESDVYSFGIILYELYSRKDPYEGEDPTRVLKEIMDKTINKRPPVPPGCPAKIADIMTECLDANPEKRPTFEEIDLRIKRLDSENVEPGELMFRHYQTKNSDRNEDLLHQVFPKHIANALRDGRKVEPDRAELATMFFSDIVGFTNIAAELTPDQVSDMLDRLYLKFDALSEKHNVFKIETIGDAYVGVTNLVEKQDDDHAKRVAEFAVDALQAAAETPVLLDEPNMGFVRIRVGMHSGPLVARVVGARNPRYCVFGDTVNTAARMESYSKEGRIQCSERTANILQKQCPDLSLTKRGAIKIKGKGEMVTFYVGGSRPP